MVVTEEQVATSGTVPAAPASFWDRAHGFYQRNAANRLFRRRFLIRTERPLISFTFDDFPTSALYVGGEILKRFGAAGTYYASLGTMGQVTATGKQFEAGDIKPLLDAGHELGSHTYPHCHSWDTNPRSFEEAVIENQRALDRLVSNLKFKNFAYPISPPRPFTKVRMTKHFWTCRGGGQTLNHGITDLNHLKAFFLEKSTDNFGRIQDLIDYNRQVRGWLVLATHDVTDRPTAFGVVPEFFEQVVGYAKQSGAQILTVAEAMQVLQK
jgi:peptidoglycan/xylan/chitin deacetylase (PgdA/CDA1 family)